MTKDFAKSREVGERHRVDAQDHHMIDKLTFAVGAMKPMVAFYSAVLGLKFVEREMFGRTLSSARFGDIDVLFCPKDLAGVEAETNTIQLRFVVDDAALAFAQGMKFGGIAITEPAEVEGSLQASLRDPDGNSLELTQPQ